MKDLIEQINALPLKEREVIYKHFAYSLDFKTSIKKFRLEIVDLCDSSYYSEDELIALRKKKESEIVNNFGHILRNLCEKYNLPKRTVYTEFLTFLDDQSMNLNIARTTRDLVSHFVNVCRKKYETI